MTQTNSVKISVPVNICGQPVTLNQMPALIIGQYAIVQQVVVIDRHLLAQIKAGSAPEIDFNPVKMATQYASIYRLDGERWTLLPTSPTLRYSQAYDHVISITGA